MKTPRKEGIKRNLAKAGVSVAKFGGKMVTDSNGNILDYTVHTDEKAYKNALNRQRTLATNGAKKCAKAAEKVLSESKNKTKLKLLPYIEATQKILKESKSYSNRFKTPAALKATSLVQSFVDTLKSRL
jgi:hypothetical protein